MGVAFTCSIDDGYPSDMKMAELLHKHGLNGTFFVPVKNREGFEVVSPTQMREISRHFEIGSHTFEHCYLNSLDLLQARYQVIEGKKRLEDLLGTGIAGFCYPGGKHRQRDVGIVKAAGFKYARTVMNLRFDAGDKPFEMPTTVQFYPHDSTVYLRNFATSGDWLKRHEGLRLAVHYQYWIDRLYALFDYACTRGGAFHLWGHSKEIDELNAWREMDRFLAYVSGRTAAPDRLNNEQLAARYYLAAADEKLAA
jgi:peptidoglycan/xylan/chitin deacetylase (PgdA/CDA1 family)